MKKLIFIILAFTFTLSGAVAQKLMIGERAPEVKIKEWLDKRPASDSGKPMLLEFFHSSSKPCIVRLDVLDKAVDKFGKRIDIVVLVKESKDVVLQYIDPKVRKFSVGFDDAAKTFTSYGVQFVPFSVIIDKKGKIAWFGNASAMTDEIINSAIE